MFSQENFFLSDPTLSPNGDYIIFTYDNDLWKVNSEGGLAERLTGMRGIESSPRISPDGKYIAFTATQYGNKDVYLMPVDGGEIKQLTFHDASDQVESWSWDCKQIYFISDRENSVSSYKISSSGGTPKRLFSHYFQRIHNVIEHPKTKEIFFNESWESTRFASRKRYKGDYNPDIKSYNPKNNEFKKYTSYEGKDFWPTIDKNGHLFFVSDQINGQYNLYTFKNEEKTNLTKFVTSIYKPQVSANGTKIVFAKDYQIFMYDVRSGKSNKVPITLYSNNTLAKDQDFSVKNKISYFDIAPDKKKIAFISRGELFVSDIKGKYIRHVSHNIKGRIQEVKWLKNNTVIYSKTNGKGFGNLFTLVIDGNNPEKQITNETKSNVNLSLNKQRTHLAYISGSDELRMMNLKNMESETLVKDEFWAIYSRIPRFSPDGKYIVFNAIRNFENDIFTYHLPSKKIINLTETGVTETAPYWSSDGKYILFESNLTKPSYPYGLREAGIYQMALDKYEKPYRLDKFEELFKKQKDSGKTKARKPNTIIINKKGIMDRLQRISPDFGYQGNPTVIEKEDTRHIFYISNHEKGETKLWKTRLKPFEKNKTEKVSDLKISDYQIITIEDTHFLLLKGAIYSLNPEENKIEKIDLDYTFRKKLSEEFEQMFYEAWAGLSENFYDVNFHGEDWIQLRNRYSKYLPYLTNREQLSRLFNDMLGELNASHLAFNSKGDEEKVFYKTSSLHTGILFTDEDPYQVKRIITNSPADTYNKNIQPGDQLVSVNGKQINPSDNRESYFNLPTMIEELELMFARGKEKITVKIHPINFRNLKELLYKEWIDRNQSYVDEKSNNKIAYIYMKNMGKQSLQNFKREIASEAHKKDGLILDLRYNTGGNVHDEVLNILSRKPYLQWKYRDGKLTPQPNFSPSEKPIVLLINEQTLSDAEVTAAGFKELKLGKIIGTETYRWIIFTSGKNLVDGSYYRLPSWGCYTLDGKNLEKTGVSPDIYVEEDFKDRLLQNQPQLDKAITEILKHLETKSK